jgi:hypothetical protein
MGKRFQKPFGQLERACDARVNVVALLKIEVLEEVPAHGSAGMELPYMSIPAN